MKKALFVITALMTGVVAVFVQTARAVAQEYSCGAYGGGAYNEGDCVDGAGPGSGGDVADTGLSVWLLRIIAAVLIGLAILIVVRTVQKRRRRS